MKTKKILYNTFLTLGLLFNALLAVICWIEYYTIGILNNTKDYPFGGEGPVPYYYQSSELYVLVNLVWGIIFSVNLIALVIFLVKGNRKQRIIIQILTWILIIIKIIHGLIGVI